MSVKHEEIGAGHIIVWGKDGAPYSKDFDDHFFSRAGGRDECAHVFLAGNELPARWKRQQNFTIAELGFGTGLNFLETWRLWQSVRTPGQHLEFVSFEAFPLSVNDMGRALEAWPELEGHAELFLKAYLQVLESGVPYLIDDQTSLYLSHNDALAGVKCWDGKADAWFLDGFAPSKNPLMWSQELMQAVYAHTQEGGTFATYTVAGWVRRNLQASGFEVRKCKGFAGKREMLCGEKSA